MFRASFYHRLSGFYFSYFAFIGAFAPYFALYLKSLGYSAAQIGLLLAVSPVARIFGPNIWGWLSDHYRARSILIRLTAVCTAVSFVAVFFNHGFGWMFAALMLMNVFWCGVLPLAESATLSLVGARAGRVWARPAVGFGRLCRGGDLWRLSAGFLRHCRAGAHGAHTAGVDGRQHLRAAADREPSRHAEHAPMLSIVTRPAVMALMAGFFLMQVAHGPYNAFYSIHLVEAGYSKTAVGWLWSLGVIAEIALFVLLPRADARL